MHWFWRAAWASFVGTSVLAVICCCAIAVAVTATSAANVALGSTATRPTCDLPDTYSAAHAEWAKQVIEHGPDPEYDQYKIALFAEYETPAARIVSPDGIGQVAKDARFTREVRLAALRLLGHLAGGHGKNAVAARASLEQLAADTGQPEWAAEARTRLGKANAKRHGDRVWKRERLESSREHIDANREASLTLLEKADRGELQLSPAIRKYYEMFTAPPPSPLYHQFFEDGRDLGLAVWQYATYHKDKLPIEPKTFEDYGTFIDLDAFAYFPIGDVARRRLPDDLILLVARTPTPVVEGDERAVVVVYAGGGSVTLNPRQFRERWRESNASRLKAGLPAIAEAELGAVAQWMNSPESPASKPASAPASSAAP